MLLHLDEDNLQPAVYTASDQDGDVIDWSLEGPDAGSFVLLNHHHYG